MTDFGFFRAAAAVPVIKVADTAYNVNKICELIGEACGKEVSLIVFPELCVTGYSCGDLFGQELLLSRAEDGVRNIIEYSRGKDITIVIGTPVRFRGRLYNCAAVIRNGNIKGLVPKLHIPDYGEFYESRWFASGRDFLVEGTGGKSLDNGKDCFREGTGAVVRYAGQRCNISPNLLFRTGGATFCIEICEDMWSPVPPSSFHSLAGAQITVNLSASNELLMKHDYRRSLVSQQSARTMGAYIYCSAGYGESTQDAVYSGAAMIYENGSLLAEGKRFEMASSLTVADIDCGRLDTIRQKSNTFSGISPDGKDSAEYDALHTTVELGRAVDTDFGKEFYRTVNPHPFVPYGNAAEMDARCREIIDIQVMGLATRLAHIGCRTAVIGISGGLDSTLALLIAVLAADRLGWSRDRIVGVTMPGYGTTDRTRSNAEDLMDALGVTSRRISITAACDRHFQDIGHDKSVHDVTYENSQARERTQILMDIANQTGGIVIGTGDLSELALGWATYNGDHMSMYGVNAGVPKTLIRHIVCWAAGNHFGDSRVSGRSAREILTDITETPISPELLPADVDGKISQVTEDLVGPYELHDFFLYSFLRFGYSPAKILFLARKAFRSDEAAEDMPGDGIYTEETIRKWLKTFIRRFFGQQFKRSCLPDGPKVGSVSLSPRGDWRMPSDASAAIFLKDIE